jgi:hypothetical protein
MESKKTLCKIIFYTGKVLEICIESDRTISDLKEEISLIDDTIQDFNLISSGRVISDMNKSIRSFIAGLNSDQPSLTFYANASKIHGGCHKKYCD